MLNKVDKERVLSAIVDVLDEASWEPDSDKIKVVTCTYEDMGDGLFIELYIGDELASILHFYDILLDENEDILSTKDVVEYLKSREGWSLS